MLEKFRFTIGMVYARFHFRRKKDHAVNFTDILTRAHRVLVIFPEKEFDADSASTVLRYLLRRFSARGILVLIRNDFLHVLSSAPPVKTLVYTKEDVSRWFIPKTDVITRLASNTFDAAVDLNVSLSLAGAFLCKASNAHKFYETGRRFLLQFSSPIEGILEYGIDTKKFSKMPGHVLTSSTEYRNAL